ncbi:MAG: CHAP domain-containing protein [Patescibacteria group bacterium]
MLDKIRKNIRFITEFVRRYASQVTSFVLTLVSGLFSVVKSLKLGKRLPKRPVRFIKKYSAQISFGVVLAVFLTVSVGEGQAYQVGEADFSDLSDLSGEGFLGKPQILGTETILTGETQQVAVINYTVEKGDSVSTIAARYNLSVGSLLDANGIKPIDAEKIKIGSQLVVPAEDTNSSLAWLSEINAEKARQQKLAEAARQKQLAQQARNRIASNSRTTTSSGSSNSVAIGTMRGSYNGGLPGWCTWYAHYKRPDLLASGNARDYLRTARAAGMATGSVARPGAIFVSGESGWGHAGYVESVRGGEMTISEMNYVGRYVVSRRTVSTSIAWGFIY